MINREPDMVYSDVAGVYTFTRIVTMDTETVTLRVQIIASKCNLIQAITQYYPSLSICRFSFEHILRLHLQHA